jgi:hypothetical protein
MLFCALLCFCLFCFVLVFFALFCALLVFALLCFSLLYFLLGFGDLGQWARPERPKELHRGELKSGNPAWEGSSENRALGNIFGGRKQKGTDWWHREHTSAHEPEPSWTSRVSKDNVWNTKRTLFTLNGFISGKISND